MQLLAAQAMTCPAIYKHKLRCKYLQGLLEARRLLTASPFAPAQEVIEQVQLPASMGQEAFAACVMQLQQVGSPATIRAACSCMLLPSEVQDMAMCRPCRPPTGKLCACSWLSQTQASIK